MEKRPMVDSHDKPNADTSQPSTSMPSYSSSAISNHVSTVPNHSSSVPNHSSSMPTHSMSAKEMCHSRGASTDGSTIIDGCVSSTTDSRRGTYSEAGTLPIGTLPEGTTIVEEESPVWDRVSEKKLSSGDGHRLSGDSLSIMCGFCRPFLHKHNALPANPSRMHRIKYAMSCPPHGKVGRVLTWTLIFLMIWGSLISITGEMAIPPHGNIFALMVLFVLALVGGHIVSVVHLPPLLGMLLVGILLRSVPGVSVIGSSIDSDWSATLRNTALVVILLRAGLGLDPHALRQLSFMVLRLAFSPCLVETVTVAVTTHFLLGFPWQWGFMLGFILAAVSPAVVVPCLLSLCDQGYGVDKGIPTLVIAAASIDDVLAISGFGVLLGITFSTGSLEWTVMKGPLEVLLGLGYGGLMGALCWLLPYKHEKNAAILRFLVLLGGGMLAVFGSQKIKFAGAGALGCLSLAFVAGIGWRSQGWSDDENPVADYIATMWSFFQPLLFGLIGTEIQVMELDINTVGYGVLTLCIGLTLRVITSFLVVAGGELNLKERLFVAFAWLPKATVQAAIGSKAYDYARQEGAGEEYEKLGKQVLTIAVLVILITAPLGAAAIMLSAPKLLNRTLPPGQAPISPETSVTMCHRNSLPTKSV
ncbi:sodium/hydrogen exchanger 9B2-like isoform X2 [Oratosquilla oratoria]